MKAFEGYFSEFARHPSARLSHTFEFI